MQDVIIHTLPTFEPSHLKGGVAVVIDVLRASTSITYALANGAAAVIPCTSVEEARRIADAESTERLLLAGERGGVHIDGFDLGNSPQQYTRAVVAEKTIVFTTSHGTPALDQAKCATIGLVGSFVNINAVIRAAVRHGRPIHLVCSGTGGQPSLEDCACAAYMAKGIWAAAGKPDTVTDETRLVAALADAISSRKELDSLLESSRAGRNLSSLGFSQDIEIASQWDRFRCVPTLCAEPWSIRGMDVDQSDPDVTPPMVCQD